MVQQKGAALIMRGEAASLCGIGFQPMIHWQDTNATVVIHLALSLIAAATFFLSSCVAPDRTHRIVISAKDQKLALLEKDKLIAIYPISTSKYGLGDGRGTWRTPVGELEVAQKIGDNALPGTVFKDRHRTGETVAVDAPGRDPIVTRILWLRGRELQNANAYARDIYIHGTPEERNIGKPVSYGCIRMRSTDVIQLYDLVGRGAVVTIVDAPLVTVVPEVNKGRTAQHIPGAPMALPAAP